jgi:starvation-inducible DNA-binding protein
MRSCYIQKQENFIGTFPATVSWNCINFLKNSIKILEEAIDEIAERINKLGAKTPGTLQEFLQMTSLKESPGKYPSQKEMIRELLKDHEAIIIQLRKHIEDCDEKYGDIGTSDFLTDMIKEHETIAWTLRRYLS